MKSRSDRIRDLPPPTMEGYGLKSFKDNIPDFVKATIEDDVNMKVWAIYNGIKLTPADMKLMGEIEREVWEMLEW